MKATSTMRIWCDARRHAANLLADRRGLAAVEFAFILPVMMVMLFGTVEVSTAIAIDRKVTLMARTLSDLTSQATKVEDTDFTNFFAASYGIMTPYPTTSAVLSSTITEIYVDASKVAHVQWSKGSAGSTALAPRDVVPISDKLAIAGTYLIMSQVSYSYTPTVGYVMKSALTMKDSAFTRPRQSQCVMYGTSACTTY